MEPLESENPCDNPDCRALTERLRQDLAAMQAAALASRRVRARVEAERDAFQSVFDYSPVVQVWLDHQGKVIRANKAAQAVSGAESASPHFSVYTEPALIMLGVPEYFDRALAGETVRMPPYAFNASSLHDTAPDADLMLETVLHPVSGPDGVVHSVVVQHFDVTRLHQLQREAQRLRAELEALRGEAPPAR